MVNVTGFMNNATGVAGEAAMTDALSSLLLFTVGFMMFAIIVSTVARVLGRGSLDSSDEDEDDEDDDEDEEEEEVEEDCWDVCASCDENIPMQHNERECDYCGEQCCTRCFINTYVNEKSKNMCRDCYDKKEEKKEAKIKTKQKIEPYKSKMKPIDPKEFE